jgi:uncharacterized protein
MREFFPFIDPRLEAKWIDGVGHAIFSKGSIPSQTFVEMAPVVIFDPKDLAKGELVNYVLSWGDQMAVGLGWTMVYNHCDENNCEFSVNHHEALLAIMTIREISAGEQLTVNYGPDWFSSRNLEKRLF